MQFITSYFRFCPCAKPFHLQVVLDLKLTYARIRSYPQADAEISYGKPRPLSYTSITIHYLLTASFDAIHSEASLVNRPEIKNVITFGD